MKFSKLKKIPLFFLIVLLSNLVKGQSPLKQITQNKKIELSEKYADSLINSIKNDKKELKKTVSSFVKYFYKKKNISLAIKYSLLEIETIEKLKKKDPHYQHLILQLGYFYYKNKNLELAIETLNRASNLNFDKKRKGQAFCLLGKCFYNKGDYSKSLIYYEKGVNLLKSYGKPTSIIAHSLDASLNSNFTLNIKHIKKSLLFLKLADSVFEKNKKKLNDNNLITIIKLYTANTYSHKVMNNFSKANYYYNEALKYAALNHNIGNSATILRNIGEHYLENKNDSSIYFLNKSLEYCKKLSYEDSRLTKANAYLDLSDYYYSKNKFQKALENSYLAFDFFYTSNNKQFKKIYPDVLHQKNNRKNSSLITYKFNLKALIALIEQSNQKEKYINEAIISIKNFNNLISVILDNDTNTESQFQWRKDASEIYNYAAYIYYLKQDYQSAFNYLEKNKAFLLAQNIDHNNVNKELPKVILDKDKSFKKDILNLEYKLVDKEIQSTKDSLFDLRFSYQQFKDSIRTVFPKYFQLKSKTDLISLQEVQKNLDDHTVIISYSIQNNIEENSVDTSIGLCISKNNSIPFSLKSSAIKNKLQIFSKLISKPLNSKKEVQQYNSIANSLYNSLFPSEEIKNLIQNKKVVIIPDDNLQNIPFEAFITDTTSNRFLIEDTDISYAYSMSFLNVNNNISRVSEKDFAGFAPIEFQNKNLATLQYSAEEINSINNNLNGTTFTGADVTKDNFFTNASNAKIIHLATHADVSQKPVIHFSKDSLNLHELYTYKNNADLVVLSACETNVGELKKGEGILNLARGFFYSGSKSVVSSLWKVNDAATTKLMTDFYTNLKDHQSKSEALNNAKRKYLNTHSLSEKSPYYWASFILIGDTTPTFEMNYTIHYIIAFSILLILFFIFFKKRG
ncbi:CHAT domain-containing tetratricopeptide repeat protein [uncultured Tenacibaculum sp.]|uniref:CHAT domain-containing protein n=1 Tax=uncultured Tenacibaculum sp. TaxID=174713 RepID=UPI002631765E|nr:CHAT domain-containing tetratricopeptide repeat protein [uncultured Tenacibaculum sp.]